MRAVRSLRSPDAQSAARFVRPLPQALGGLAKMRVRPENYKVFSWKKFLVAYLAFLSLCVAVYFIVPSNYFETRLFLDGFIVVYLLLQAMLALWSFRYGQRVLSAKVHPPPNSWVLSNWKVVEGRRATTYGWLIIPFALLLGLWAVTRAWLWFQFTRLT